MQYLTRRIDGIDGSAAELTAYIPQFNWEFIHQEPLPAVLILPSGGYAFTSAREAEPIALQFLARGYNAFTLHYSIAPGSHYPVALLQVARSVRWMHEHADRLHLDPRRIAVMGFSAGGHLAAHFATSASDDVLREHGYDPAVIRADALMLGYAVLSAGACTHEESMRNLLGERADDPRLREQVSPELHVDGDTPPVFLWHTMTDDIVSVENGLRFIGACGGAGVPIEAHLYPKGIHGSSLGTYATESEHVGSREPAIQSWFGLCADWLDRTFGMPAR